MDLCSQGIHHESLGCGPDLVMVHGWAMHGGLLREMAGRLSSQYRVTLIDLPGHGGSAPIADYSLKPVVERLVRAAPASAHWLGWSLGALLSLAVTDAYPERVRSLVMVAGTPRFTADGNWPGVDPGLLQQMSMDLEQDYSGTVKRFVGLQSFTQNSPRSLARRIQEMVDERSAPDPAALSGGLALLRDVDARPAMVTIQKPVLAILGARDRLIPRALAPKLKELNRGIEVHEIASAAHLPFITHPDETAGLIAEFLSVQSQNQA